jgi:hypothetical protein
MNILLHNIRRITIVQSNVDLNSFSDALICNYIQHIVVTTGEVVYSPVITLGDTYAYLITLTMYV